ncbi:hypothetical protein DOY81_007656, partial [Sarcophaga bullata]
KKGKKNKGTVISLQSFLSNGDVPVGTTQVAKNIRNVDGEDSDEGGNVLMVVCQLPTAPRANRIFDDNTITHKAPFVVYLTNLPFDVKEDDVYDYFNTYQPRTLPLPDVKLQADIEHKDAETSDLKSKGISAEKVFGSAKPVDTIAKDLEIEERLAEVRLHKAIKKDDLDQNELNIGKNDQGVNVDRSWCRHQACDEISNRSEDKKIFRSALEAEATFCGTKLRIPEYLKRRDFKINDSGSIRVCGYNS